MSDPFKIQQGTATQLNITTATLIEVTQSAARPVRAVRVNVIVAGSAPGTLNDVATTAGASGANTFFDIPNVTGSYLVDWPCALGLVVVPGTGQTVSICYD